MITKFMDDIKTKLENKGLAEGTINNYLTQLKRINDGNNFNSLYFLGDPNKVTRVLEPLKQSTRRSHISAIITVLELLQGNKRYNALLNKYRKVFAELRKDYTIPDSTQKTESQKKNWIEWDEVLKKYEELNKKLGKLGKNITKNKYDTLLDYVILSLYTLLPPRRNADYQYMIVVKDGKIPDEKLNYYDMKNKKLIFRKYKTSKKFGEQEIDLKDNQPLLDILELYLKHHPLNKGRIKMFPLLVKSDGTPLRNVNDITHRLNKIFGKKISSSMLRHIYLTDKYGDEAKERKKLSDKMAHSIGTQYSHYIKN